MALAVALVAPLAAGAAVQPRYEETPERYELENEDITVWFQGKKPLLKVFPSDNDTRSYQLHFLRVAEFADEDGDGAYSEDEATGFVSLARADAWNTSVDESEDGLTFELTLNETIRQRGGGPLQGPDDPLAEDRYANVTVRFHVFDAERTLETVGGNLTVEPGEVKFDVVVNHWGWQDPQEGKLAFVSELPAANGTQAHAEAEGDRVAVERNGTAVGYATWQDVAEVTDGNETEVVDVEASYNQTENGTLVAWAYNASGYDGLLHDPTIGVITASDVDDGTIPGTSDIPGPALVVALSAAAAAAVLRREP